MSYENQLRGPVLTALSTATTADDDATVAADAGIRLMGYSVSESTATPAVAEGKIVNGATGAAAGKVVTFSLAGSTSETVWFGGGGIPCPLGLSIDHLAGTFDIILYYIVIQ